jgi:hypothetical protein
LWCGLKDRVYLKEGRERIEKGGSVEKKKVQGVFDQTAISFFPLK